MTNWECSVCGYVHKEAEPPEKCPVCEAPTQMFKNDAEVKQEPEKIAGAKQDVVEPEAVVEKRWRCTICGYVHTGDEPPEKCPICDAPKKMFVEIDSDGKALEELKIEEVDPAISLGSESGKKQSSSLFDKFANFTLKHHLHPVTVHFPNGILPAVVLFLILSVYFNIVTLETAAYYNLIFVLLMLPIVLLTGFIEWQKRYKGIKSAIFITKILCSLIILGAVNILVFWRLLDPGVVAEGSPWKFIYLGIAAGMLCVVGLAGYLGGKLVFASRG